MVLCGHWGGAGGGGGTQRTQMRQEGAKNPASLILKGQVWRKIKKNKKKNTAGENGKMKNGGRFKGSSRL